MGCLEGGWTADVVQSLQLGRGLRSYCKLDTTRLIPEHVSLTSCQWGMSIANSWRISGDIYDSFSRPDDLCSCTEPSNPFCVAPGSHCSVVNILNKVAPYVDRGQPGGWNDLDMLEVGNGGMTDDEVRSSRFYQGDQY